MTLPAPTQPAAPRALIAEDEPLLAAALAQALRQCWPALEIVATVGDGLSAVREALRLAPDVLFFDIRMPGQSGLEAAAELADAWPPERPFPALVFVTAYDQYALQAFDAQAMDYLVKPVQAARLEKTVQKLQLVLANQARAAINSGANFETTLDQLRHLLQALPGAAGAPPGSAPGAAAATAPLRMLQAGVGTQIRMVPVDEVLIFEAADKYVRVLTATHEHLLRTPLKELAAQLDPNIFWQVHRSLLVRATEIAAVTRDEAGRLHLSLHTRPERLPVSRLYAHRFKAM
ncbi:LytTR family DNA-binding domain-containing protein [Acidovorax lacteus]|uniref:LytTR family DNA-binding domain-containing protein n=1 Tax=Acidovorax lacteus TaxID=1924988 RepID=A0ABP8L704_9BURK